MEEKTTTARGRYRDAAWVVRIDAKCGVMNFNVSAMRGLDINRGQKLLLLGDASGVWKFALVDEDEVRPQDGFRMNVYHHDNGIPYSATVAVGRETARKMLDTDGDAKEHFCISRRPETGADGRQWHRIITATPYVSDGMFRGQ